MLGVRKVVRANTRGEEGGGCQMRWYSTTNVVRYLKVRGSNLGYPILVEDFRYFPHSVKANGGIQASRTRDLQFANLCLHTYHSMPAGPAVLNTEEPISNGEVCQPFVCHRA